VTARAEHEAIREDLGGYVLGGLTVDEQRAVERHLATCADCRKELAELDPVPVLLTLAADAQPSSPGAAAPTEATEPIPLAPHRERRSRGRRVGAALGMVAAVAAAFLIGLVVASPGEAGYGTPVALHAVGGSAAQGTVAVRTADHGVEVRLVVSHLPSGHGTWYECVWWSGGAARSAGSFTSPGQGQHTIDLTTAADLGPGWSLAIVEHPGGRKAGTPVLATSA
jgi:hypothetical protein